MTRSFWSSAGFVFALMAGIAACSGPMQSSNPATLPNGAQNSPAAVHQTASGLLLRAPGGFAGVTPPFQNGETLTYAWSRADTVTRWSGATASPSPGPTNTSSGTFVYTYSVDKKNGVYTEVEKTSTTAGNSSTSTTLFGFVAAGSAIDQEVYSSSSDNLGGGSTYSSLTNYPVGETAFVFPAKNGSSWSAAAPYLTSYSQTETASTGNGSSTYGADGSYVGQDQFTGAYGGFAEQYHFAFGAPAVYVLSIPGYGSNPETWKFGAVKNKSIPVTTSGKAPLLYPAATTQVADWYPHGKLPDPAYADNYTVAAPVKMPSNCGTYSGKSAADAKEIGYTFDPILGTYDTWTLDWYLDSTQTLVCQVYGTVQTRYANGNAWESLGSWGGPWFQLNYLATEILKSKKETLRHDRALAAMPAVPHAAPFLRGIPHLWLKRSNYDPLP